ncbi:MAG: class I SAM-dependent methyltransferase [Acidimicrobiales bacterium]
MYLIVRDRKPQSLVEISPCDGWSTIWLLLALRDNRYGSLCSYDLHDRSKHFIPLQWQDRWLLQVGDVMESTITMKPQIDFLLMDSAHSSRFAKWYFKNVFPAVDDSALIMIHDIDQPGRLVPGTEARLVSRSFTRNDVDYFTASSWSVRGRRAAHDVNRMRRRLGIDDAISKSTSNPSVFLAATQVSSLFDSVE